MIDIKKALSDPSAVFRYPRDVLEDQSLSDDLKRRVLEQWRIDAVELMTADEENMSGDDSPTMLSRVMRCLAYLDNNAEDNNSY
jgi:hypothetical protein